MKIKMRDYQGKAHAKIWKAFSRKKKVLAVLATGLGKTILAAFCALTFFNNNSKSGKRPRALFLCHDNYILGQSVKEFRKVLGELYSFGVFHGQEKVYDEVDILFASFQTLAGNGSRDGWMSAFLEDEFDFVIVDESHHGYAKTYKSVIDYFKPKYLLGITATPDRMDEKNIRDIFGKEVVNYSLEEAIARGWLTPIEYRVITDNLNTPALQKMARKVLKENNRVSVKQLNETIFVKARDEKIAEIIMAENKKTMIFCESILHAENFGKYIPGSAVCHSKKSFKENERVLEDFKEGKIQYVLSVNQFNEGKDIPDVELVVFLRCTDSETIFFQQLGRGLRKILGKMKVVVLDFVANCDRVAMIKDLEDRVIGIPADDGVFEKNPLHLSDDAFKFVFGEDFRKIADILAKIKMKRMISDIPELVDEYMAKNLLPADKVRAGTGKEVWWKCSVANCCYEWREVVHLRVRGYSCPACMGKIVTGKNNLAVTHPKLAKEYMPPPTNKFPANKVIAKADILFWWKCKKCKHEWDATGNHRVLHGSGCPACAGNVVTVKNNLAVTHPKLAKEYMPPPTNKLPVNKVMAGINEKVWWKCEKCKYEWDAAGNSRSAGAGCPSCAGHVVTEKNNLAVTHPELAKEYMSPPTNNLPVNKVVAGIVKKVWWKCKKCKHEWDAAGSSRVRGNGCPACAGKVATDKNNLTVTHFELAKEYMPPPKNKLPANKVVAGTSKKLWWKCRVCRHEWDATGANRSHGGTGCPKWRKHKK